MLENTTGWAIEKAKIDEVKKIIPFPTF